MQRVFMVLVFLVIAKFSFAQELRCNVQVVSQKVQGTNKQVFQAMQKDIYEFMNNRKWTDHLFAYDERIECTIMINISEQIGSQKFIGTVTVQARRPVYNSTYNTVLLNYKERDNDFQFDYIEQQPLEFDLMSHKSNLTSLLAFYAYLIIGIDYDSFSTEGGTEYFQKALTIVNNAQNSADPGWKAYENLRNRYWIIENLTSDVYSPMRRWSYRYHRLGLDRLGEQTDLARAEIAESLKLLQFVYRKKPNSILMDLVINAKSDEWISIFSESYPTERNMVYNILKEINPSNTSKYEKIIKPDNAGNQQTGVGEQY